MEANNDNSPTPPSPMSSSRQPQGDPSLVTADPHLLAATPSPIDLDAVEHDDHPSAHVDNKASFDTSTHNNEQKQEQQDIIAIDEPKANNNKPTDHEQQETDNDDNIVVEPKETSNDNNKTETIDLTSSPIKPHKLEGEQHHDHEANEEEEEEVDDDEAIDTVPTVVASIPDDDEDEANENNNSIEHEGQQQQQQDDHEEEEQKPITEEEEMAHEAEVEIHPEEKSHDEDVERQQQSLPSTASTDEQHLSDDQPHPDLQTKTDTPSESDQHHTESIDNSQQSSLPPPPPSPTPITPTPITPTESSQVDSDSQRQSFSTDEHHMSDDQPQPDIQTKTDPDPESTDDSQQSSLPAPRPPTPITLTDSIQVDTASPIESIGGVTSVHPSSVQDKQKIIHDASSSAPQQTHAENTDMLMSAPEQASLDENVDNKADVSMSEETTTTPVETETEVEVEQTTEAMSVEPEVTTISAEDGNTSNASKVNSAVHIDVVENVVENVNGELENAKHDVEEADKIKEPEHEGTDTTMKQVENENSEADKDAAEVETEAEHIVNPTSTTSALQSNVQQEQSTVDIENTEHVNEEEDVEGEVEVEVEGEGEGDGEKEHHKIASPPIDTMNDDDDTKQPATEDIVAATTATTTTTSEPDSAVNESEVETVTAQPSGDSAMQVDTEAAKEPNAELERVTSTLEAETVQTPSQATGTATTTTTATEETDVALENAQAVDVDAEMTDKTETVTSEAVTNEKSEDVAKPTEKCEAASSETVTNIVNASQPKPDVQQPTSDVTTKPKSVLKRPSSVSPDKNAETAQLKANENVEGQVDAENKDLQKNASQESDVTVTYGTKPPKTGKKRVTFSDKRMEIVFSADQPDRPLREKAAVTTPTPSAHVTSQPPLPTSTSIPTPTPVSKPALASAATTASASELPTASRAEEDADSNSEQKIIENTTPDGHRRVEVTNVSLSVRTKKDANPKKRSSIFRVRLIIRPGSSSVFEILNDNDPNSGSWAVLSPTNGVIHIRKVRKPAYVMSVIVYHDTDGKMVEHTRFYIHLQRDSYEKLFPLCEYYLTKLPTTRGRANALNTVQHAVEIDKDLRNNGGKDGGASGTKDASKPSSSLHAKSEGSVTPSSSSNLGTERSGISSIGSAGSKSSGIKRHADGGINKAGAEQTGKRAKVDALSQDLEERKRLSAQRLSDKRKELFAKLKMSNRQEIGVQPSSKEDDTKKTPTEDIRKKVGPDTVNRQNRVSTDPSPFSAVASSSVKPTSTIPRSGINSGMNMSNSFRMATKNADNNDVTTLPESARLKAKPMWGKDGVGPLRPSLKPIPRKHASVASSRAGESNRPRGSVLKTVKMRTPGDAGDMMRDLGGSAKLGYSEEKVKEEVEKRVSKLKVEWEEKAEKNAENIRTVYAKKKETDMTKIIAWTLSNIFKKCKESEKDCSLDYVKKSKASLERAQPDSAADFFVRLRSFRPTTWVEFGHKSVIDPVECAMRGWYNSGPDCLMSSEGAKIIANRDALLSFESREAEVKRIRELIEGKGHQLLSKWIGQRCPREFREAKEVAEFLELKN